LLCIKSFCPYKESLFSRETNQKCRHKQWHLSLATDIVECSADKFIWLALQTLELFYKNNRKEPWLFMMKQSFHRYLWTLIIVFCKGQDWFWRPVRRSCVKKLHTMASISMSRNETCIAPSLYKTRHFSMLVAAKYYGI